MQLTFAANTVGVKNLLKANLAAVCLASDVFSESIFSVSFFFC